MSRPTPSEPPAKRQRAQGNGGESLEVSGGLEEEQEFRRLEAVSAVQDELNALGEEEAQQASRACVRVVSGLQWHVGHVDVPVCFDGGTRRCFCSVAQAVAGLLPACCISRNGYRTSGEHMTLQKHYASTVVAVELHRVCQPCHA